MSIETNFKVLLKEPLTDTEIVLLESVSLFHELTYYGVESRRILLVKAEEVREIVTWLAGSVDVENIVYIEQITRYIPDWDKYTGEFEKEFKAIVDKERTE